MGLYFKNMDGRFQLTSEACSGGAPAAREWDVLEWELFFFSLFVCLVFRGTH